MGALQTFEASLRHAVRERQAATVGGGHFTHQELNEVLSEIEALRNAKAQLEAMVAGQEPVACVGSYWNDGKGFDLCDFSGNRPAPGAKLYAAPVTQQPRQHVGDSRFESWYSEDFDPKNKGSKQQMREAYEAGMNDKVAQQPQAEPTDSMGIPLSCGKPLCSPGDHHPLCKLYQKPQAEAVLRKLEWAEVRHEYREAEYFCPICDRDKRQGHEAGCELAAALTHQQAEAVQACGHPMSLLLRSAESNEPLYCEACDDKSGRHDAERRETELLDANRRLQEKIASADALKLHAIEELCQLGYTVKGGELFPPDHLHKLMEAANHPLCGKQTEAVPSSALNPDESDSVTLWAEIWRLREAVKGPDGYATWQDAATAERIRRVRAESKQAEASALIERMADALRSCSGVPHWPSFQPLINEASKWKVEAVPPTHVLVPVEPTVAMLQALSGEWHPSRHRPDLYRAMIAAAIARKGGV